MVNDKQLLHDVIEKMDSMVRVMDEDDTIIFMNKKMRDNFGNFTGKKCYEMLGYTHPCEYCVSDACFQSQKPEYKEERLQQLCYQIVASPVVLDQQDTRKKYAIEIFNDITEQRRIEQQNLLHYERLKRDLSLAKKVQSCVLPVNDNYWDSLYVTSYYQPSEELSGDVFDIVRMDENRILFYMADVSGHGIRSSLFTMFLRQIIRSNRTKEQSLSEIIQELIDEYRGLNVDPEQYFTIVIGLYDKIRGCIQFINAGHNCSPVVIKKQDSISEIEVNGMPVCSLLRKTNHEIKELQVQQGDRIMLYTDGIAEASGRETGESFGTERVLDLARIWKTASSDQLIEQLMSKVEKFSGKENKDDIAVLITEIL